MDAESLSNLVADVARAHPDRTALVFEGQHLSYRALCDESAALASRLVEHGVRREEIVAIHAERSIETVVGMLAVLEAGAAYLPLDPSYPRERLAFMLRDSGARLLLVGDAQAGHLRDSDVVELPLAAVPARRPRRARLSGPGSADGLAYVMYTSGSTGRPKGIMVSHCALVNHIRWRSGCFALGSTDRTLQRTPISFDISAWEIFGALLTGGTLVLPRPGAQRESRCLVDAIIEHEVTAFQIVPSMLKLMAREPKFGDCASLRHVFVGGEALPTDLVAACRSGLPEATVVNVYGPTETTIDTTYFVCDTAVASPTIPIGRPVANTSAAALDDSGSEVREGHEGVLYVGGSGLARGYWRAPDRTAEAFVPNGAAGASSGERLYNTGDVVRVLPGDAFEFLGRRDGQIKVHGCRIELREIELVLKSCPLVADGLAMVRRSVAGEPRIVCYYVLQACRNSVVVNAFRHTRYHEVREYLAARMPEYMVPHHIVNVDALPLLPNGKVDMKALPEPAYYAPGSATSDRPQTEKERVLARVWCDVLGVPAVGCNDLFAYYGGDSLQMVEVRLGAQKLGLLLDLTVRHQSATVRSLAANAVWAAQARGSLVARARQLGTGAFLYCRAMAREWRDTRRQRYTARLEQPERRRFREFYARLRDKRDVYYLFFRTELLHWVFKQLEFIPDDVNVVLFASGLTPEEWAWVRARTDRPLFHTELLIDDNAAWELLFDANEQSFGWIELGCFVNNSALFHELARIEDDVAFNCVYTHTERHRRTFVEYLLFVNIRAIQAMRAKKLEVYPSRYNAEGSVREEHQAAWHRVPRARDRELVRSLLEAEERRGVPDRLTLLANEQIFRLSFFVGHLFLLHVQQLGFRMHRVRHLTASTHLNYHNFFSDEIVTAPHISRYERLYVRDGPAFDADLEKTLQADYALLRSMCAELPSFYATRLADLEAKLVARGVNPADAASNVVRHLMQHSVHPETFDLPQWRFLREGPHAESTVAGTVGWDGRERLVSA